MSLLAAALISHTITAISTGSTSMLRTRQSVRSILAVDRPVTGIVVVNKCNVDRAVEFTAKYLPEINPQVAANPDELRDKVRSQYWKCQIVDDGLSSVFIDSDGAIRAASFVRKMQIGAEDQDVYVGQGETQNKMGKIAMLARWQEQDKNLRPDQCATFGYLAVDINYFQAPRGAGATAAELLDYNLDAARRQGIRKLRSPSQGLFKDTVLSLQADFAIWSANDTVSFASDYLTNWNDYATRPDPCRQWEFTGSLAT